MRSASGRGWVRDVALSLLLPAAVILCACSPSGAARKGDAPVKAPELAQIGDVAFWNCPAKKTQFLVVVNTLTLHPGQTLDVSFTVRNSGTTSCGYTAPYAGVTPGPTSTTLTAGPCGSVGFQIEDSHHHNVWPGSEVVNCPALGFAQLAAGATVSGTGSWRQTEPNSTHRVPTGNYTLTVENKHFNFSLRVAKS
jgi:hypothetical protein